MGSDRESLTPRLGSGRSDRRIEIFQASNAQAPEVGDQDLLEKLENNE